MMGDYERIRLVTLGGPAVGKSAIVKRFLFNTFSEKYKPTVEDLYNQEYDFGSVTLKVDILDTAGDLQFPAMRRLSIATAHAFLITYSVDNRATFELVKGLFEEIREQRADFEDIPIVVTGNKIDVGLLNRNVQHDEVCDWLECSWPSLKVKVVDCSAKEDINIRDVFRSFLPLSKLAVETEENVSGLKRRSSASSAHAKSPVAPRSPGPASASNTFFGSSSSPPQSATPPSSNSRGGTPTKNPASPSYQQFLTEECALSNRQKPRSRSLMRRSSKKVKQQVRDVSGGPGDCQMS
ncbi:GTP-binding protein Di-Ras2-like [Folsomia candida]|uniref:GTP-binding protein Di-Ras2-like n=1 Tax=Folsomia candida TaxID=158441 RepID=UPI0016052BF4|nr:GTP-binding protein Di-Ras2-like [Folsomia candida]XP_035714669.1 GTP-binding protein Di-Ras2-like [Folsomia candida]